MGFQREVRTTYRTQAEIESEARRDQLDELLGLLEAEIDRMKGLADDQYQAVDLNELEARLRRLADRAQVAGSAFIKQGK